MNFLCTVYDRDGTHEYAKEVFEKLKRSKDRCPFDKPYEVGLIVVKPSHKWDGDMLISNKVGVFVKTDSLRDESVKYGDQLRKWIAESGARLSDSYSGRCGETLADSAGRKQDVVESFGTMVAEGTAKSESHTLRAQCGACGARLKVKTHRAKKAVTCPKCGGQVIASETDATKPAAPPAVVTPKRHSEPRPGKAGSDTARVRSSVCPHCGSASYTKVPPLKWDSLTKDRCCSKCGTCYVPLTPLWVVLLLWAVLLAYPAWILFFDAKNAGDIKGALIMTAAFSFPIVIGLIVRSHNSR